MPPFYRALLFACASLMSCNPSRADIIFTPTNGNACRDLSRSHVSEWACPGPRGFIARFLDEGNIAAVILGSPANRNEPFNFRGAGKVFGDRMEWHLVKGKPRAAVLRIWRIETASSGAETEIQQLAIFAINDRKACPFATVAASQPNANEKAAQQAETATSWLCTAKQN